MRAQICEDVHVPLSRNVGRCVYICTHSYICAYRHLCVYTHVYTHTRICAYIHVPGLAQCFTGVTAWKGTAGICGTQAQSDVCTLDQRTIWFLTCSKILGTSERALPAVRPAEARSNGEAKGQWPSHAPTLRGHLVPSSKVTDGGPFDPAILFLEIHAKDGLAKISNEVGTRLFNSAEKARNNPNVHPYNYSAATKNKGREGGRKEKKREREKRKVSMDCYAVFSPGYIVTKQEDGLAPWPSG